MALDDKTIGEIRELFQHGSSIRGIARYFGISKNTVKKYIRQNRQSPVNSLIGNQLVKTTKKLPATNTSSPLYSYHRFQNNEETGDEMAGKRAEFTLKRYRELYQQSTKLEKGNLLDEFCRITHYHRKYAVRLLKDNEREVKIRKPRPRQYSEQALYVIQRIWKAADYPWSQRLVALLPLWLPWAKQHMQWMTQELENEILSISARQIDRRLNHHKAALSRKMYGRTKPGKLLKHHISIKTDNWDVLEPGFTEIDLVAHCGNTLTGEFIYSLNFTDIHTGWVETWPIMGKTQIATLNAIKQIRSELPFQLKGIDSDNGSEFINKLIFDYCKNSKVQFTRSRPYKKDDNAHIEQKNWTHVRRIMGYNRYDSEMELTFMKALYRKKLRFMMNLFQPCVKLIKKERTGSKLKKKYDLPKTPLDRLIAYYEAKNLPIPQKVNDMKNAQQSIDPFKLSREIDTQIQLLIKKYKDKQKTKVI